MTWAKLSDLKAGDLLRVGSGFDCMEEGAIKEVQEDDDDGDLFILCGKDNDCRHYLDGQADMDQSLYGLYSQKDLNS